VKSSKPPGRGRKLDPLTRARRSLAAMRERLRDAEATLDAIRMGAVDALVVQGPAEDQVFMLRGADRRYRQLVETMNEGALLIAPTGLIVYGNRRFAALIGTPLERVIGSPIRQYFPDIWQRTLDAILHGGAGAASHAEAEIVTRDGERLRVYLSSAESHDEGETLTCLIVTDLGEQQRSREALAAERLAGLIVEQAAEGVVVCDIAGTVVRASRAAELVAGANPLLRRFEEAFPLKATSGAPLSASVIKRALRRETLTGVEATLSRNGEERVLLISAGPILSGEGESLGAVVSFVDITERKHAAEERTQLLERATTARAEAEDANRAKDEFLAMLGHELRNPLAPILTALQLMHLRSDHSLERERAVIERQVKHLVTLVDDLLDVSRITRGRVELQRRVIELSRPLASAIELTGPIVEERQHHLHVEKEPELWVEADETRLAQVFSNLLSNAAKYTERGGHIWVRAFHREGSVVVSVRDNGTGLPLDMIPHVFDLFVQGKQSLERSQGGLGLGLAIVRSLVSLHGGRVVARSEGLGHGSEFELSLPAARVEAVAAVRETTLAPERAPSVGTSSRRVLVVDDNVDAAQLLAEALTDLGHNTRVAYDGPSALTEAARFQPEVALLDIGLPVMDGFELARRLRRDLPGGMPLRLIALTGYGQGSDRERSAEAGFDRHFVKPVRLEELNQVIEQLTA
jgi:PAS domain S-box-containing protein